MRDQPQFSIYYLGVDKRILVWDLAEGTLLTELKGHSDTVYSLSFSRDGNMLASGLFSLFFKYSHSSFGNAWQRHEVRAKRKHKFCRVNLRSFLFGNSYLTIKEYPALIFLPDKTVMLLILFSIQQESSFFSRIFVSENFSSPRYWSETFLSNTGSLGAKFLRENLLCVRDFSRHILIVRTFKGNTLSK